MRGAGELGVAEAPADLHAQRKPVLDAQRVFGRMVRQQGRRAEAGRNGSRQRDPQELACPAAQQRVAERDLRLLSGQEVADVHRVEAGLGRLEHDGRVAVGQRVLVRRLGVRAGLHGPVQDPPADLHLQFEQHRVQGERKGVHRLYRHRLVVTVGLGDAHLGEEVAQHSRDRDVAQRDLFPVGAGQCGCRIVHSVSSPFLSCW